MFSLMLFVALLTLLHAVTSQPVIERVSGCTDVGSTTQDCVLPATLTVYGHGFLTGLNENPNAQDYLDFVFEHPSINGKLVQCYTASALNLTFTDTLIECQVPVYGLMTIDTSKMLGLYLQNELTGQRSSTFLGVKLKQQSAPIIRSVSGCQTSPSPLSAARCRLDADLLTLTGDNFLSIQLNTVLVNIGPLRLELQVMPAPSQWTKSLTDTQMVISFISQWKALQAIEAFNSHSLTFSLGDAFFTNWQTNEITLQFDPMPLPSVTGFRRAGSTTCQLNATTGIITDCEPGEFMPVEIIGNYFFGEVSVAIGGVPCRMFTTSNTEYRAVFELPAYDFPINQELAMTVTSVAGTVIAPYKFVFKGTTMLTGLVTCIQPVGEGSKFFLMCAEGDKVGFHLMYASNSGIDLNKARFQWRSINESLVVDLPCTYAGPNGQFSCTVPPQPLFNTTDKPFVSDDWGYIELVGSSPLLRSQHTLLWTDPTVPRIHTIAGCQSTTGSDTYLDQCLGEEIITLTGVRFRQPSSSRYARVYIGYQDGRFQKCRALSVSSDNRTATCEVPTIEQSNGDLLYNTPLRVYWSGVSGPESNFMTIMLVPQVKNQASKSSVSSSTIAIAVVFSIVGAVLLTGLAVWFIRKQRGANEKSPRFVHEHSDSADIAATEMI